MKRHPNFNEKVKKKSCCCEYFDKHCMLEHNYITFLEK